MSDTEHVNEMLLQLIKWKISDDASERKQALGVLKERAPNELALFKQCVKGSLGKTQKSLSKKLVALDDAGFAHTAGLALLLSQHTKENLGLRYLCERDLPQCKNAIEAMIDDQKRVDLSDLTRLPSCLAELDILNLHISRLDEAVFPLVLTQMNALEELCLHVTQFTSIPKEISQLQKLHTLKIYYTQLSEVPAAAFDLPLRKLDISTAKKLTTIPKEISRCAKTLEYLRFSWTKIATLPESISACEALRELTLEGNKKLAIPDFVWTLTTLRKLELSSNMPVGELSEGLGNLTLLEELDLGHSQITSLPDTIGHLKELTHLSLVSSDELLAMPESFYSLKKVKRIFIGSGTLRDSISPRTAEFPELEDIR